MSNNMNELKIEYLPVEALNINYYTLWEHKDGDSHRKG